ncbi:hypothetical protein [Clostridium facile]|uniref:ABC-2 family transporter protein n=1 Tax=Clostridium facile TaxID=2763035 RepID=A0ABR7ISY4_9CLOT|nr:hypothetical protein [Clostridium facile]MBC5788203.1 hypothetical protein [Clostridium facile]PWM99269.1 MAG: hypothetical protein DBX37_05020 [Massilioclostridium sp.]
MGRMFSSWKADCNRFIFNSRFWLSVFCIVAICFLSSSYYIWEGTGGITTVSNILYMTIVFSNSIILLVLFASFPAASSFCSDWNCQYIRCHVSRSGIKGYIGGRILSCITSSFLACFLGILLFVLILLTFFPLANAERDVSLNAIPTLHKLYLISPWLYLIYHIFIISLATATWSVVGLCISAWIPNRFIALLSPFICYYILDTFSLQLPMLINFYHINKGTDILNMGNPWLNLLYIIAIYTVLMALFGCLFGRTVKRRVGNEIT